jgi:type IX secretion system PorP/SprF family membrane protein
VSIKQSLILLLVFFGIYSQEVLAQDVQFSQFYAASLYLNPAFAGSAHSARGTLHQRIQWPSLDAKYITSLASIDAYSSKYKSGFGLMILQDFQGSNTIKSSEVTTQYSYELQFSPTFTLRAGLQAGFVSRFINYSNLVFPDQYNNQGYTGPTDDDVYGNTRVNYLDLASGGILYSNNFWFGVSSHHMNRPNQSFYGEVSRLPSKYSLATGYKFVVKTNRDQYTSSNEEVTITPTAHYKFQGMSDQFDLGVYAIYNQIIMGFWYRGIPVIKYYKKSLQNNESVVLLAGYKFRTVSVSYSYDFTISKLATAKTGGSHELNITYVYKKSKKKKPTKRLPCPKFYGN